MNTGLAIYLSIGAVLWSLKAPLGLVAESYRRRRCRFGIRRAQILMVLTLILTVAAWPLALGIAAKGSSEPVVR